MRDASCLAELGIAMENDRTATTLVKTCRQKTGLTEIVRSSPIPLIRMGFACR